MRLVSTALTGFFYTATRLRTAPKMSMMKYDPRGELASSPSVLPELTALVNRHVLFLEGKRSTN